MPSNITTFRLTPDAYLYQANCLDVLQGLPENCIDSVVCDPPYHLTSIVKRFGNTKESDDTKTSQRVRDRADGYSRLVATGFMGKQWDGGDIAFRPETWAEVLRVMKPGAHLVAFGAPRNYHRMVCAIEDAGFEIRDSLMNIVDPNDAVMQFMQSLSPEQLGAFLQCIDNSQFSGTLAWCFGTGFPKSQNVSKFIDRELGIEREKVPPKNVIAWQRDSGNMRPYMLDPNHMTVSDVPVSPQAIEFDGFGTALKPAFEPIVLARKPLSEPTVAANVLRWRTGAINIDACRVDGCAKSFQDNRTVKHNDVYGKFNPADYDGSKGRWPANICHSGEESVLAAFPDVGGSKVSRELKRNPKPDRGDGYGMDKNENPPSGRSYSDGANDSAARFFYSAKANKTDRAGSLHPTIKPVSLMSWLVKLVTPKGGVILDPFAGSGTTGQAALENGFKVVMVERELEYCVDIQRRIAQMKKSDAAA